MLAGAFGSPTAMPPYLSGQIVAGNTAVPIYYPNWTPFVWPGMPLFDDPTIGVGATDINNAITSTPGQKIVFAHSLGAVTSSLWLMKYGPTSTVPPDELCFVLIGNSVRSIGGFIYENSGSAADELTYPLDTPYPVFDIAYQYDGWADWPNAFANNLTDDYYAVMNGQAGMNLIHTAYAQVDLTSPLNRTCVTGNVTFVLAPHPLLPYVMVNEWIPSLQQSMNNQIQPLVESCYNRSMYVNTGMPIEIPGVTLPSVAVSTATAANPAAARVATALSPTAASFAPAVIPTYPVLPTAANVSGVTVFSPVQNLATADRRIYGTT